ncbi:MAG: NAD(P)-dependent oxidoreductase [Burkholderiaceae bacterium]
MAFEIALTRDLLTPAGQPSFGAGPLELLDQCTQIRWQFLPENVDRITPDIAARFDGLYVNAPLVPASAVARADCRLRIVARHGVGFDSVDVAALAARDILVTNTPVAVQRPVAVAALTMIFALAGRLFEKDQLTRAGRWHERTAHMGLGLTSRTLGIIGAGGIGKELLRLARPFGWKMLAADPHVDDATIRSLGAQPCSLDALLRQSDFVVACCVLDERTHHLMNAARFATMREQAFFVNLARGPVADEAALIDALRTRRIAGAGIDVFEQEPVDPGNPLLSMDNVIVTPHSLCWTDECFDAIAREGLGCLVAFAQGRRPASVVNVG